MEETSRELPVRSAPTLDERCGLPKGYAAHHARGEDACAACKRAMAEKRRAFASRHPDAVRDSKRRYASAHSEEIVAKVRAWREQNPEKTRAMRQRYYEKNRERLNAERLRDYYANKEVWRERARKAYRTSDAAREKVRRRRALKLGRQVAPYTTRDILDRWGSNCYLCLGPIDLQAARRVGAEGWEGGLHLDHAVPLSRGGLDTVDNVRPAHGLCDILKGAKTPEEFWDVLS